MALVPYNHKHVALVAFLLFSIIIFTMGGKQLYISPIFFVIRFLSLMNLFFINQKKISTWFLLFSSQELFVSLLLMAARFTKPSNEFERAGVPPNDHIAGNLFKTNKEYLMGADLLVMDYTPARKKTPIHN
jgi:hypothetical protein